LIDGREGWEHNASAVDPNREDREQSVEAMNLQGNTKSGDCVTFKGRGPNQQPAAMSGMTHNNVQSDMVTNRQEFGSNFVFNDTETFPQLFTASSAVLTNAQCGSRFNSENENLVFDSEFNSEIESGQLTTMVGPDSQVEVDVSTQKKTVWSSPNSGLDSERIQVPNSDEIEQLFCEQLFGEKFASNSSENLRDTASETVPKSLNFPAELAIANTDSEQYETAGMVPRSIRDRKPPSRYDDYQTDFARTITISRIKFGKITDNDAINTDNNNYNSAIKKHKRKSVVKMQQNKCKSSHSKGSIAVSETRNVKECNNNSNFVVKQRTNVSISGRKHLTEVTDFGRFSRQKRIEIFQSGS